MTDKYTRFKQSMLDAGYVPVPRGYVTPEDAETIRSMLIKKTDGNSKIVSNNGCAQPRSC
jgi:hypothetical protein